MSKKAFIITIILLVVVICAAVIGYNALSGSVDFTDDIDSGGITENRNENEEAQDSDKKVPDFTVTDETGSGVSLSAFRGKPVVINFWATWCGPCRSEMPHFQKMYKEHGDEINFMMVNLTDGHRETLGGVKSFIKESGYTLPFYFDTSGKASGNFDLTYIPLTVFIDSNGNYLGNHVGAMTERMLSQYIDALIGE